MRAGWAYLVAAPLILLSPLATFLQHDGYPVWAPSALAAFLLVATGGLVCGAVMALGGWWIRVPLATALVTLMIDLQTTWFARLGLRKGALVVLGVGIACWVLHQRLGQILAVVFGAMCLGAFTVPSKPFWRVTEQGANESHALGAFVQVILDGHIGIEGIPREFDPDGKLAASVQQRLEARGFTVFTRAYSEYYDTSRSVPTAVNLEALPEPAPFSDGIGGPTIHLRANATAEILRHRGYRLHVIQTDYVDLCHVQGRLAADVCATYALETVRPVRDLPLTTFTKAELILGSFRRLSALDHRMRARFKLAGGRRLSTISAMDVADRIERTLAQAKPGDAFLIHLMLPHYPYVYDADCQLRPDPATWLKGDDPAAAPRRNTSASRRLRYPLYLSQLQCTQRLVSRMLDALEAAGVYEQATIILHGDHGSRLDTGPPIGPELARLQPQDFVDAFSTLFAVKLPGRESGSADRRALPLPALLRSVVSDGHLPSEPGARSGTAPAQVWVDAGANHMESRVLPPFAYGAPAGEW